METKVCRQCQERKPLNEGFYKQDRNIDGHYAECKECIKQNSKRAYREIRGRNKRLKGLILEIQDKLDFVMKEMGIKGI